MTSRFGKSKNSPATVRIQLGDRRVRNDGTLRRVEPLVTLIERRQLPGLESHTLTTMGRGFVWCRDHSCCACSSGEHPGPVHDDGASVGVSTPGIVFFSYYRCTATTEGSESGLAKFRFNESGDAPSFPNLAPYPASPRPPTVQTAGLVTSLRPGKATATPTVRQNQFQPPITLPS